MGEESGPPIDFQEMQREFEAGMLTDEEIVVLGIGPLETRMMICAKPGMETELSKTMLSAHDSYGRNLRRVDPMHDFGSLRYLTLALDSSKVILRAYAILRKNQNAGQQRIAIRCAATRADSSGSPASRHTDTRPWKDVWEEPLWMQHDGYKNSTHLLERLASSYPHIPDYKRLARRGQDMQLSLLETIVRYQNFGQQTVVVDDARKLHPRPRTRPRASNSGTPGQSVKRGTRMVA